MNKIMTRLFACALCLTIALVLSLSISSPSAHAATSRATSSALSTNFEHEAHSAMAYSVTWYQSCPTPLIVDVRLILTNDTVTCFTGSGYLGVPIIQGVRTVQNYDGNRIWFVYYQSGSAGIKYYLNNGNGYAFNPPAGVTQVCLGC